MEKITSKAFKEVIDTNTDKLNYTKTLTTLDQKCGADLAIQCLDFLNGLEKSLVIDSEDEELKLSGDGMVESSEES